MIKVNIKRKLIIALAIFALSVQQITAQANENSNIDYNKLIHAIGMVESGHNTKAVSDNGKYVGYLQIGTGMVNECNRILKSKKYCYKDRYDKDKSIEMFHLIMRTYNPNDDLIHAIRLWNEGVNYKKDGKITKYVQRVLKHYKRQT